MKIITVAFIATLTVFGGVVSASAQSYYAGAHLGMNYTHDGNVVEAGFPFDGSYDLGYAIGGFVGREFGGNTRVEGEFTYRSNGIDSIGFGGVDIPASGDISSLALMANVYRDFPGATLTPYVGGGLGVAFAWINDFSIAGTPVADDSDTVFAYQLIAGIGYPISPTVTVNLDYRLFGTSDIGIKELPPFTNVPLDFEYLNSSFMVGLRTTF